VNPIESHFYFFGSELFDSLIGNSCGAGVVCLHRGSRLWMPISIRAVQRGKLLRALWNKAPNSAYVSDAMMLDMMALIV
jgi:hypothetical protein